MGVNWVMGIGALTCLGVIWLVVQTGEEMFFFGRLVLFLAFMAGNELWRSRVR